MTSWGSVGGCLYGVVLVALVSLTPVTSRRTTTTSASTSLGWNVLHYPNPQQDVDRCGRGKVSWVCDPAHIITSQQADELDAAIEELRANTGPCVCDEDDCPRLSHNVYRGFQPAIALVDRMYMTTLNPTSGMKLQAASEFAEHLRDQKWEFGECNDDFVIFVSRDDRQVFTATGEEARVKLTDKCVKDIFKNNSELYKKGEFGVGLKNTIHDYMLVFQDKHPCRPKASPKLFIILGCVFASLIGLCCLGAYCKKKRSGGSGGGGGDVPSAPVDETSPMTDYDKGADMGGAMYPPVVEPPPPYPGPPSHHSDHHRKHSSASSASLESGGGGGGF